MIGGFLATTSLGKAHRNIFFNLVSFLNISQQNCETFGKIRRIGFWGHFKLTWTKYGEFFYIFLFLYTIFLAKTCQPYEIRALYHACVQRYIATKVQTLKERVILLAPTVPLRMCSCIRSTVRIWMWLHVWVYVWVWVPAQYSHILNTLLL